MGIALHAKPLIIAKPPSETFSTILLGLDICPIVSSIKALIDRFCQMHWKPNVNQLNPYAKTYYYHLSNKDQFRYIAIIPFIGNFLVLAHDVHKYLASHALSKTNPIQSLGSFVPKVFGSGGGGGGGGVTKEEKPNYGKDKFALKRDISGLDPIKRQEAIDYFSKHHESLGVYHCERIYDETAGDLPPNIKKTLLKQYIKEFLEGDDIFAEGALHKRIKNGKVHEKDRIFEAMKNEAEKGNKKALEFLKNGLSGFSSSKFDAATTKELLEWLAKQAGTLSPISEEAFNIISGRYYFDLRTQIVSFYLTMLENPDLPQQRVSTILTRCTCLTHIGTPEEQQLVFSGFLKIANLENPKQAKIMYKLARIYKEKGQNDQALRWFEKAAEAQYPSSILLTAFMYCKKGELGKARS